MILKTICCTAGSKQQRWLTSQSNQLILAPCSQPLLVAPVEDIWFKIKKTENISHLQRFAFRVRGTWHQLQVFISIPPETKRCLSCSTKRCNLVAQWQYYLSSVSYKPARAALARCTRASSMFSITKKSILHNPVPLRPINGTTSISAVKLSVHVNHCNSNICTVDAAGIREDDLR